MKTRATWRSKSPRAVKPILKLVVESHVVDGIDDKLSFTGFTEWPERLTYLYETDFNGILCENCQLALVTNWKPYSYEAVTAVTYKGFYGTISDDNANLPLDDLGVLVTHDVIIPDGTSIGTATYDPDQGGLVLNLSKYAGGYSAGDYTTSTPIMIRFTDDSFWVVVNPVGLSSAVLPMQGIEGSAPYYSDGVDFSGNGLWWTLFADHPGPGDDMVSADLSLATIRGNSHNGLFFNMEQLAVRFENAS
jgi:hypothetical protein